MQVLVVRHGESEGNRQGKMQGHLDAPLTERGRDQARRLASWLVVQNVEWDVGYASPLARAQETAKILAEHTGNPASTIDPDLRELHAGSLEGLTRDEMIQNHPGFLDREITQLGDFEEFGGESYESAQKRVRRFVSRLEERHREAEERVLVVAHGGFNFQMVKAVTCIPVPRVNILRWGNCTTTQLTFRDRRGVYMAEVNWHIPIELMGGESIESTSRLFR